MLSAKAYYIVKIRLADNNGTEVTLMRKFKLKNERLVFTIMIITLFVVFLLYYNLVFSVVLARNSFANEMVKISDENEKPIFSVQKVLYYSSANAIDHSDDQSLKNMSICQYTDISVYLDNISTITELTNENTVKELYIDNIKITSPSEMGIKTLNYKSPLSFGKYKVIEKPENDRIDFNIIKTNAENENTDYSKPTFYTDCSNPISFKILVTGTSPVPCNGVYTTLICFAYSRSCSGFSTISLILAIYSSSISLPITSYSPFSSASFIAIVLTTA